MQATEVLPQAPAEPRDRPARDANVSVLRSSVKLGQRSLTVRRLDPWTILKLSVVFYSVILLLFMLLLTLLWAFLSSPGGIVETVVTFAREAQLEVTYNASQIARAIFLLGILGVVALSGVNVFFCFVYNLVADLTGGLRLSIDDER